ncbi:MAG: FxLYD domain-containing protein [Candidatus Accumulibacter sp. UW26]|jgi:hypothetical protein
MTIATTSPHRLLTLAALVTLTVACNNPTPAGAPAAGNPVTAPAASEAKPPLTGLSLVEVKVTRNPAGKLVVQGRVDNASDKDIGHAEAELRLFDKDGVEVGSVAPAVNNLKAGFSWSFESEIAQKNAVRATLAGFTGK